MKTLLKAAFVATMEHAPLLRDGAVVFDDTMIADVGAAKDLLPKHPDARVEDLGGAILLPGLINAHTHLELSDCVAGESAGMPFHEWIIRVRATRTTNDPAEATRIGIAQCLKFGVTCVGDITQQIKIARQTIAHSPLRCVSYGETIGLAKLRSKFETLLRTAIDESDSRLSPRLTIGLSPHAPYTVDLDGYRECVAIARAHGLPLATHLAETPHEREFLEHHRGPFRDVWEQIGSWSDLVETFAASPIRFTQAIGLLDLPAALLAHVNYCDDDELEILARGRASVVYCPRTHAYFSHPPHRWREMLSRGINVVVGTDSCASSPNPNLVDDLRLLHHLAPETSPNALWQMATLRAARAVGQANLVGSIAPGKAADFVTFKAMEDDPLRAILESDEVPESVWIAGERVKNASLP